MVSCFSSPVVVPSVSLIWRSCSLKYYFNYLLSIKENDDLADSLDNSQFGTFVHEVLNKLYTPFLNRPLTVADLRYTLSHVDESLQQYFSTIGEENTSHGKIYLQQRVARKQIEHLVNCDIKTIESGHRLQILALEQPLVSHFDLPDGSQLNLFDKADRIDLIDGLPRIVDYKTGKVEAKELLNTSEKIAEHTISDKSFQVLMYAWLYLHNEDCPKTSAIKTKNIVSGIYPIGDMRMDFLPLLWDDQSFVTSKQSDTFGGILRQIVTEISDADVPFKATDEIKNCGICPYKSICPKQKTTEVQAE